MTPWQQLVAAAERVEQEVPLDWDEPDSAVASEYLNRNGPAIDAAAALLTTRSSAPFRLEKSYFDEIWPQIVVLRQLTRALYVRGKLALAKGDSDLALKTGTQLLDLAGDVRREALLANGLVADAIAGTGLNVLRKMRRQLDVAQRRRLIENLFRHEAEYESLGSILARDLEWEIATDYEDSGQSPELDDPTIPEEFRTWFLAYMEAMRRRPPGDRAMEHSLDNIVTAKRRLLIVDLALRNWQQAIDAYPAGLRSLVPHDLPALPLDPFTNAEFIYRRQDDSFLLYSVGPKRYDAGGQFGPQAAVMAHEVDLALDGEDE